jgi:hypothetical protein
MGAPPGVRERRVLVEPLGHAGREGLRLGPLAGQAAVELGDACPLAPIGPPVLGRPRFLLAA